MLLHIPENHFYQTFITSKFLFYGVLLRKAIHLAHFFSAVAKTYFFLGMIEKDKTINSLNLCTPVFVFYYQYSVLFWII